MNMLTMSDDLKQACRIHGLGRPTTTDQELHALYLEQGDEQYLAEIHNRHYASMVRQAVILMDGYGMGSAADYAAGRAFDAFRRNYREGTLSVKHWLSQACRQMCNHFLRRGQADRPDKIEFVTNVIPADEFK